jgi:staphylococcal nuclease domain-containing protein 1
VAESNGGTALAPEYLDVYVSAVRDSDPFGFSVQVLDTKSELPDLCWCRARAD